MAPLRFALSAALKAKLQSGWEIDSRDLAVLLANLRDTPEASQD
jgi:hypothetical protein